MDQVGDARRAVVGDESVTVVRGDLPAARDVARQVAGDPGVAHRSMCPAAPGNVRGREREIAPKAQFRLRSLRGATKPHAQVGRTSQTSVLAVLAARRRRSSVHAAPRRTSVPTRPDPAVRHSPRGAVPATPTCVTTGLLTLGSGVEPRGSGPEPRSSIALATHSGVLALGPRLARTESVAAYLARTASLADDTAKRGALRARPEPSKVQR